MPVAGTKRRSGSSPLTSLADGRRLVPRVARRYDYGEALFATDQNPPAPISAGGSPRTPHDTAPVRRPRKRGTLPPAAQSELVRAGSSVSPVPGSRVSAIGRSGALRSRHDPLTATRSSRRSMFRGRDREPRIRETLYQEVPCLLDPTQCDRGNSR